MSTYGNSMFCYDDNMMGCKGIRGTFLNNSGCISNCHILLNCCMNHGIEMLEIKIMLNRN